MKYFAALAFFIWAHVYTVTEDGIAHRSFCDVNPQPEFCKDEIK